MSFGSVSWYEKYSSRPSGDSAGSSSSASDDATATFVGFPHAPGGPASATCASTPPPSPPVDVGTSPKIALQPPVAPRQTMGAITQAVHRMPESMLAPAMRRFL